MLCACQLLIEPHQFRHAAALRHGAHVKAIGPHNGPVVVLVGLAKLRGHDRFIIEVSQAGIGVQGPCVQDGLGRLFNSGPLLLGGIRPWKKGIDNLFRIAVISF